MKSPFDTGHWSEVNGLPGQNDIIHYLENLLSAEPNRCYTRRGLMEAVIKEFNIPIPNAEVEGPKSDTPAFYTRMTYLITDAVQGKRRADGNQFAKRLSFNVYQHIDGDGEISSDLQRPKTFPEKLVGQAMVSVKMLKELGWTLERIQDELHLWSDEIVEEAINRIF